MSGEPISGELLMPGEGKAASSPPTDQPLAIQRQFLKFLSTWLDNVFVMPGGWRFGLDPIIGLIPVVGDLANLTRPIRSSAGETSVRPARRQMIAQRVR